MGNFKLTSEESAQQYPGKSDFVHLHTHTLYSLLDGVASPEQYFKACAERKWPAIAITEHGMLNSIPDNYLASKENKVKYLCANEVYYCDYELQRRKMLADGGKLNELKENNPELASRMTRNRHLTVISKNQVGYSNLLQINRKAWEQGFYYRPRTWFDAIAEHKEGLIILSGCMNGPVSYELRSNQHKGVDVDKAVDYMRRFRALFGDDYYVELQMPGVEGDVALFESLAGLAREEGIKTVLTNDSHYLERKDYELQRIMMAIDQDTTVDDPELFITNSSEQYFKTRHELRATFHLNGFIDKVPVSVFEESCDNTLEVADKCESFKPDLEPKLPKIENPDEKLARLAWAGLKKKGLHTSTRKFICDGVEVTYKEQMMIELNRIIEKKFSSYFLITKDLIDCSLSQNMPLGPARGSSGGSLMCYLLEITSVDPLLFGLSFDRFMSPARGGYMLNISMPR